MTSIVRRCVAATVGLAGQPARWSRSQRGLALAYHRVAEASGDAERELVPAHSIRAFDWQLRHLRRYYRPVRASELRAAALSRRRGERFPVAVTFDDDLPCHRQWSMPALRDARVPATFFLCGASLDSPFLFWWERLQVAVDEGVAPSSFLHAQPAAGRAGSSPGSIHAVAEAIEAMPHGDREVVVARLTSAVEAAEGCGMSAADVRALATAGFEIGFHTLHHHPLPTLDDEQLHEAMREGRERLASVAEQALTAIAYPHGRADARVAAAARTAGFDAGFTVAVRPVRPRGDPLLTGRLQPPLGDVRFAFFVLGTLLRPADNSLLVRLARRALRHRRRRSGRDRSVSRHSRDLSESLPR